MRHFHLKRNTLFCPVINIDRLWNLVTDDTRKKFVNHKDKVAVIDVTKAGYFKVPTYIFLFYLITKVLGKGRLPP